MLESPTKNSASEQLSTSMARRGKKDYQTDWLGSFY